MRRPTFVAVNASLWLALASAMAAGGSLQYQIPPGWIDLRNSQTEDSRIPQGLINEARRGKYVIYAVDPENLSPVGANATFNVIETPGRGVITEKLLQDTAAGASTEAERMGFEMKLLEAKVVKLGGVDVGVTTSLMSAQGTTVRLLQYLIPGRESAGTLTYACMPGEFDRYRPIFEASAMATTGAYKHRSGIDWGRAFLTGAITGFVALIASLITARKKKSAAAAAPAVAAAPSATSWECPTCRRRVPMRIEQCRCGAPKPG